MKKTKRQIMEGEIEEHCRVIKDNCESLIRNLQLAISGIDKKNLGSLNKYGIVQGQGLKIDRECYALSVRMADLEILKMKTQ